MRDKKEKTDELKSKAIASSGWGFFDKGIGFLVQFLIGIVLARLLPPSDFGLIGLAMIVIGFGEIFVRLGLGPALIQKQNITERHIRVVLTSSVIAGILLAIIVFYSTPIFVLILENQNIEPIIRVLSLLFIIAGFQIPSEALLKKELDFRHIFYINLNKTIFYGVITIIFALLGFGVWSLVIGNIISRITNLLGNYYCIRHSLKPLFSKKEFYELAHFGSGETLSGIFSYFALKGDYFIIGKMLGEEALGLYTKSYSLMQAPTTRFVGVLTNVLFPTAVKLQSDSKRLRRVFLKSMRTIAYLTLPLCVLIVVLAPELILGLYGSNWEGAIIPLQILGGFGVFRAMYNASASFLKAKGKVFRIFWAQVIYGLIVVVTVWFASEKFGLVGASWAVGCAIFFMWCIMMELNYRTIEVSRLEIVYTLQPGLILSIIVFSSVELGRYLVGNFLPHPFIELILLLLIGLVFTIIGAIFLPQKWFNFILVDLLDGIDDIGSSKKINLYLQIILNFIK